MDMDLQREAQCSLLPPALPTGTANPAWRAVVVSVVM